MCIDPYLTNSTERKLGTIFVREFPPPLKPDDIAGANAVLVTHHHGDHLDLSTLIPLSQSSPDTVFIVSPYSQSILEKNGLIHNVIGGRQKEPISIGSIQILPFAASHPDYQMDDNGDAVYLGYGVILNGVRLYHSGDTMVTTRLIEEVCDFKPDIIVTPINGADYKRSNQNIIGNMNYREAADFAAAVHADIVIPVHYDLFPINRDNPAYFVD